jgi:hypothetical protein
MAKKSRISPALARIAARGMQVSEEEIRTFNPGASEQAIAEAMLAGCLTFQEIAEAIGKSPPWVSERLRDPLLCAWASRMVHQLISHKIGMIDSAMFQRALGGDVRAADLLYKRYGAAADIKLNVNVGADNFDLMSDTALDALLARARIKGEVIDVPKKSGNVRDVPPPAQDRGHQEPHVADLEPHQPPSGAE